eukprot:1361119-Lingulodinium_polyedra.AAC.1
MAPRELLPISVPALEAYLERRDIAAARGRSSDPAAVGPWVRDVVEALNSLYGHGASPAGRGLSAAQIDGLDRIVNEI